MKHYTVLRKRCGSLVLTVLIDTHSVVPRGKQLRSRRFHPELLCRCSQTTKWLQKTREVVVQVKQNNNRCPPADGTPD